MDDAAATEFGRDDEQVIYDRRDRTFLKAARPPQSISASVPGSGVETGGGYSIVKAM